MRTTTFQFDEDLVKNFKITCLNDGVSMRERLEGFMRQHLKELEVNNSKKQQESKLEIFGYIDSNLNTMTKEELKNTNLKLQEIYENASPATKQLIQGYAARIKQKYTEISG